MRSALGPFPKNDTIPVIIESNKLVIIEFPMPVRNTKQATETALNMIGGVQELCRQSRISNGTLELKLSPELTGCELARSPTSDRISGVQNNRISYALRLRRRRRKVNSGQNDWFLVSGTIIGRVSLKFRWTQLSEPVYQIFPTKLPPPLIAVPEKFFPPASARLQDYGFRQAHNEMRKDPISGTMVQSFVPLIGKIGETHQIPESMKAAIQKILNECEALRDPVKVAHVAAEKEKKRQSAPSKKRTDNLHRIPTIHDKTSAGSLLRKEMALNLLQELFEKHPMWIRVDIQEEIPEGLRFVAVEALPLVAFTYLGGPWRNYWVRYGYNPFNDPVARFQQLFNFRLSKVKVDHYLDMHGVECTGNAKENRDRHGKQLLLFDQPLSRQVILYMHKLVDREIQEMLLNFPRLDKACATTGWFSHETMRKLRVTIYDRCQQLFGTIGGGATSQYNAATAMTPEEFLEVAKIRFEEGKDVIICQEPQASYSSKDRNINKEYVGQLEPDTFGEVEGEHIDYAHHAGYSSSEREGLDDDEDDYDELPTSKDLDSYMNIQDSPVDLQISGSASKSSSKRLALV